MMMMPLFLRLAELWTVRRICQMDRMEGATLKRYAS